MLNFFHKSFISWNYYIRSLQWMKNLLLKLIWIKLNDSPRLVVVNFNRLFSTSTRNRDDFFERNVSLKRILFSQAGSPLSRTTVVPALVRAGVPAFLLAKPLRAYTLTHSKMGEFEFFQWMNCTKEANTLSVTIIIIISIISVYYFDRERFSNAWMF